ncbi:MAG: LysR family transcriptional regulator [Mogibacterium sp.]|nr:LysR family transcriptional regulator [Mogibacterium sp.]
MNIRDIDCFLKVYECRNMSIAAEKLFITPQGLSTIIRRLEEELDCVLFNRDRAGSVPTECGEIFYRYALGAKTDYETMLAEISRAARKDRGVIRFGYSFGAMTGLALDFPIRFRELYPGYRIEYTELPDFTIEELVSSGEIDVGVVSCIHPEEYDATLIHEAEILFVPCGTSRFLHCPTVTVADIAEEPLTLREGNFTTTRIMMDAFAACGRQPEIVFSAGGILSSLKMCRENRANTVILDNVAKQFGEKDFLTIPFDEPIKWPLYVITRKDQKDDRMIRTFIAFLMKNIKF